MNILSGTLIWRREHAADEKYEEMSGHWPDIQAALLRSRPEGGCECCGPAFKSAMGLRASLTADGRLSWSLTAVGAHDLGLTYMARHIGEGRMAMPDKREKAPPA